MSENQPPLGKRVIWFIGIWGASVATLAIVAYAIRLWLKAA